MEEWGDWKWDELLESDWEVEIWPLACAELRSRSACWAILMGSCSEDILGDCSVYSLARFGWVDEMGRIDK